MRGYYATTALAMLLGCAAMTASAKDRAPPVPAAEAAADDWAAKTEAQMTDDERFSLLHGFMPIPIGPYADPEWQAKWPKDVIPGAGYVAGVPRLGIPSQRATDASLGVTNPFGIRKGDSATALPAGLALGASFNPDLAFAGAEAVASEARAKGFNVLLGGGMNLIRDPRNGRNFEYISEDPLLSGIMGGAAVRGAQSAGVVSTVKHFSLNSNETNRHTWNAEIEEAAHRESDLLAFQIAIERGHPGSVMCAYNLVNGQKACGNDHLLNTVLKKDWRYKGWVMSDWGAVSGADFAIKGLDQQAGEQLDKQVWFDAPLKAKLADGSLTRDRLSDMVRRILRSMKANGLVDAGPAPAVDMAAHAAVARRIAEQGIVLLKNDANALPLAANVGSVAVIVGKLVSCGLGTFLAGRDGRTAMRVGMTVSQIGEFSFIIASLGLTLKVTSGFLYPIAVTVSAITTLTTPYLIRIADPLSQRLARAMPPAVANVFALYGQWLRSLLPQSGGPTLFALTAGVLSLAAEAYGEIYDGFEDSSGWSMQDVMFDIAGAGFSVLRNSVPGLADKLDFRLLLTPNRHFYSYEGKEHYRQQKFLFALKLGGFETFQRSPLRFVDLELGYYASGFTPRERARGDEPRRHPFIGLGLNVNELLFKHPDSWPEKAAHSVLTYIQLPYTSVRSE